MNVRTYGFNFDKTIAPAAMPPAMVFEILAARAGARLGVSYQFGAAKVPVHVGSKVEQWWGGMMVRIRDSKGYLKLTEKEGKSVLTEETLGEGEKLAEVSFFLAHPETGNGLLTHHYHATSIFSFGSVLAKVFETERRHRRDVELLTPELTTKAKKAIRQKYAGKLELGQLYLDANLKALVKALKSVSSIDFRLTTVKTREKFLQGIAERAESERIQFTFSKEADVDDLADAVDSAADSSFVEDVEVRGRGKDGEAKRFSVNNNPEVFDEYDYDTMMKGLKLDLSDWNGSIQKSTAIQRLIKVTAKASVMQLLLKA